MAFIHAIYGIAYVQNSHDEVLVRYEFASVIAIVNNLVNVLPLASNWKQKSETEKTDINTAPECHGYRDSNELSSPLLNLRQKPEINARTFSCLCKPFSVNKCEHFAFSMLYAPQLHSDYDDKTLNFNFSYFSCTFDALLCQRLV